MTLLNRNAVSARRIVRYLRFLPTALAIACIAAASLQAQATRACLSPTLPDSTAPVVKREAVGILTEPAWSEMRTEHGIPAGSASDVSIVQDNAVCGAAMTAFEAFTGKSYPETFVIVRIGTSSPVYLMTPRREGALSTRYLLNAQYALIDLLGP